MPYSDKRADHMVMLAIMGGELPEKPEESGDPRIFEDIWGFCGRCWSDSLSRPSANESMEHLTDIIRRCECIIFASGEITTLKLINHLSECAR